MSFSSLIRWIVALMLFLHSNLRVASQITIKQGTLGEGVPSKSRNGTDFYVFYGIPFAKPPLGELRFAPPQEPDPWTGVRDAKTPPPICIQATKSARHFESDSHVMNLTAGSEDCLYLNVYTPNKVTPSSSDLLPVVVFVHGGVWQYGNLAFFDPMYFMDYPIVFVSFQYRLSIFGFLSAADDVLPGNMGMKDQVATLRWVQENIQAFGGDPKRVTMLGGSSGGMSVHFHMYSPLSAGLFHQAMSLSGTSFTFGAMVSSQTARDRSKALGVMLGCRGTETEDLVNCLRKLSAEELILSLSKFYIWDIFPFCPLAIVKENDVPGAFLTEYTWKQDIVNRMPWLTGINNDEGAFITARLLSLNLWPDFMRNYERLAPMVLFYGDWVDSAGATAISNSLLKFYFDDNEGSGANLSLSKRVVQLFSDAEIVVSAIEATRRTADKMPVYFYRYNHRNVHSQGDFAGNLTEDLGVCHGDDLISFLHMKDISPPVVEGPDFFVSKRLVQYAINFIYYGDPNGKASEKVWLPVQSADLEHLHIRTNSDTMEKNLLRERYMFWKKNILPLIKINKYNENKVKNEL